VIEARALVAVGLGAALGGILRYLVAVLAIARFGAPAGPLATAFINVTGSFCIGIVLEVAQTRSWFDPLWRVFIATGILGGYTTFSTFSFEALLLASSGTLLQSAVYVGGSVALGIGAAAAGVAVARLF
jgi:CrcB protein